MEDNCEKIPATLFREGLAMFIKDLLYKLKTDLVGFMRYPRVEGGKHLSVDYDVYWRRRGDVKRRGLSAWQKQRADITLSYIDEGSTVLDLGAGDGAMLVYMREKKNIKPIGVEISKDSLDALKANNIESIEMDIGNTEALAKLPEVDYVTGFEILEHMPVPETLLDVLKPKTRKAMIFSFPNTGYYLHRLRLLFGRFPLQWIAHPGEHVRFWTVADVKSWIPQIGFETIRVVAYEGLPGLRSVLPNLFGQGILIVIRAKQ